MNINRKNLVAAAIAAPLMIYWMGIVGKADPPPPNKYVADKATDVWARRLAAKMVLEERFVWAMKLMQTPADQATKLAMARNQFEMVKDISYIKLGVCTGECPEFLEDYTNLYNQMTEWQAKNVISE